MDRLFLSRSLFSMYFQASYSVAFLRKEEIYGSFSRKERRALNETASKSLFATRHAGPFFRKISSSSSLRTRASRETNLDYYLQVRVTTVRVSPP